MVIDQLIKPVGVLENSVDKLIIGNPDTIVTGIATTFMATQQVIEQAIHKGVNLLITHEGTFYSHYENIEFRSQDPIYLAKRQLIEESGIAIFRFHDYWHRYQPDGVMEGLLQDLYWKSYVQKYLPAAATLIIPSMSVENIAEHITKQLDIPYVRVTGDLSMKCKRVGVMVGYRGGGVNAIPIFEDESLDLLIYGEGPEWETPEYVRDAIFQGRRKALIVLGHAQSEESGMRILAEHLQQIVPVLPVHYIQDKPVFQIIEKKENCSG